MSSGEPAKRRDVSLGESLLLLPSLCWCPGKSTLSQLGRACLFPRKSPHSPSKPMQQPHCQRAWFRHAGSAKPMSSGEISGPNSVSRADVPRRAAPIETPCLDVPSRIGMANLRSRLSPTSIAGRVQSRLKPTRSPTVSQPPNSTVIDGRGRPLAHGVRPHYHVQPVGRRHRPHVHRRQNVRHRSSLLPRLASARWGAARKHPQRDAGSQMLLNCLIASEMKPSPTLIRSRYDDGGYSGGSTDRPDLQRLLRDCLTAQLPRATASTASTASASASHPAALR